MTSAVQDLLAILDLEVLEQNLFRGRSPQVGWQRVFGGQVIGQALVAASRTVEGRSPHSLHGYFLLPGDPKVPIIYDVERIRDGRSFTTRRVAAIQHGEVIFNLHASFHTREKGLDWQIPMPGKVAAAETLPDFKTRMEPYREKMGEWYERPRPIDMRYVDGDPMSRIGNPTTSQKVWLRADGTLPDDPVLHACIVTYASDMTLLDTTLLPHGLGWGDGNVQMASLDHAMWFHRPFRADDWLLYDQHPISNSGSRGLAGGSIYTVSGDLAVTVVQEGLIRTKPGT